MRTLAQQHESSCCSTQSTHVYTSHIFSATNTHTTHTQHSRTHVTHVFCHHTSTPCVALACVYVSHHLPPYVQRSHISSATLHTYIMHSANLHTQITHSATIHTRLCSALWHQQIDMHTLASQHESL